MKTRTLINGWLLAGLFLILCSLARAADTTAAPLEPAAMPDTAAGKLVAFLTPILVPLALAGVKQIAPKLPSWSLPLLAPVLGFLIGVINNVVVAHSTNLWLAAGLGLLGVAVREVKDTLKPAPNGGWPAVPTSTGTTSGGG